MAPSYAILLSTLLAISVLSFTARAKVPPASQFRFENSGQFGDYIVEYDGSYRFTNLVGSPFQMFFYNTTPNEFTLALRMGTVRSESLMRWVWEANRGDPVHDNATFSLEEDGNMVLADFDGRIVWQTKTANKGVVGFKILPNGNIVLYDSKDNYIWQSFDSPTDTLLVGQSLKLGGIKSLVSRLSEKENKNGPYSLVIEGKTLNMYYKSPNSPKPYLYFSFSNLFSVSKGTLVQATFGDELSLTANSSDPTSTGGNTILRRPRYNATLSYLRLGIDGSIRIHTFDPITDWSAWEVTYNLFGPNQWESSCQLPEKCGNFGLCEDDQCVSCPQKKGLFGWSKNCNSPKLTSCDPNSFSYYKLVGVDHFLVKYTKGDGPVKQEACSNKCTKDCKCQGYFYHEKSMTCWAVNDLKTLSKIDNSTHVAYIKAPIK